MRRPWLVVPWLSVLACQRVAPTAPPIESTLNQSGPIGLRVVGPACAVATIEEGLALLFSVEGDARLVVEIVRQDSTLVVVERRDAGAGESGTLVLPAGALGNGKNLVRVWAYALGEAQETVALTIEGRPMVAGAGDIDVDGDCYTPRTGDCADDVAGVNPAASEACTNGLDDNCDGAIDYQDPRCAELCEDTDQDGFRSASCGGDDCDDNDQDTSPASLERCDGRDNNCNGRFDETFDVDGDGFVGCGVGSSTVIVRRVEGESCPAGFSTCGDCDDDDDTTYPGAFEPCDDKLHACQGSFADKVKDSDGDGLLDCLDPDSDNDAVCDAGAAAFLTIVPCADAASPDGSCCAIGTSGGDNCKIARNHTQSDADGDGVGDACDGCTDQDGDGYGFGEQYDRNGALLPVGAAVDHPPGSPAADVRTFRRDACPGSAPNVANRFDADCRDVPDSSGRAMFPGNPEECDGLDNDCNGYDPFGALRPTAQRGLGGRYVDETFDQDADLYTTCTATFSIRSDGSAPPILASDCDDSPLKCGGACAPGAAEICDGFDNDCSCFAAIPAINCVDTAADQDNDGFTTCTVSTGKLSRSAGGADRAIGASASILRSDCDDANLAILPQDASAEVCNGYDDDCSGGVDDGPFDLDGDGRTTCGSRNPSTGSMGPWSDTTFVDCADCATANCVAPGVSGSQVYPLRAEACNGADDDCDGVVDDGFDTDGDTYTTCGAVTGRRTDGSPGGGDCADTAGSGVCGVACNPAITTDVCDGFDNDCNGATDEGFDPDGDLFTICGSYAPGTGYTAPSPDAASDPDRDCAPLVPTVHPGQPERICDNLDDNCDGNIDEGCDDDGDGYCDTTMLVAFGSVIDVCPNTLNPETLDCEDCGGPGCASVGSTGPAVSGAAIHPGQAEACDAVDNDCSCPYVETIDGSWATRPVSGFTIACVDETFDADADGYSTCGYGLTTAAAGGVDCDDDHDYINPGASEICFNGLDDDCDASARDQDDSDCCGSVVPIPIVQAGVGDIATETFSYSQGDFPNIPTGVPPAIPPADGTFGGWEHKYLDRDCSDAYQFTATTVARWSVTDRTVVDNYVFGAGSPVAGHGGNANLCDTGPLGPDECFADFALVSPVVKFPSTLSPGARVIAEYRRYADHDTRGRTVLYTAHYNVCDKFPDGSMPTPGIPYAPFASPTPKDERCDMCVDGEYVSLASWGTVMQAGGTEPQCFFDLALGSAARRLDGSAPPVMAGFESCPLSATPEESEVWRWKYADVTPMYTSTNSAIDPSFDPVPATPSILERRVMWRFQSGDVSDTDAISLYGPNGPDDGHYIDDVSFFVCTAP